MCFSGVFRVNVRACLPLDLLLIGVVMLVSVYVHDSMCMFVCAWSGSIHACMCVCVSVHMLLVAGSPVVDIWVFWLLTFTCFFYLESSLFVLFQ